MIISFKKTLRKNLRLVLFILLIFIIASASIYSNQVKKIKNQKSNELINNVYFKKTLNYLFNNLKPKYKKYHHKVSSGETFDKILKLYLIDNKEINEIKKNLSQKVNLNKLNTKQSIILNIDLTNNTIKEFIFQINNKEKIYLKRNDKDAKFNQEIISIKWKIKRIS